MTPHPARVPMKCIGIAVHPLPWGEGKGPFPILSPRERGRRQRPHGCVQRKMWVTLSSLRSGSGGGPKSPSFVKGVRGWLGPPIFGRVHISGVSSNGIILRLDTRRMNR